MCLAEGRKHVGKQAGDHTPLPRAALALRSVGFSARTTPAQAKVYKQEATGATIILPDSPLRDSVLPHHLVVVRTVLKDYGISDPTDPTVKVPRVS
jgi:hypothetical protein